MKNWLFYIYYLALILVLILYVNTSGSPNMVIRIGYIIALVLPLLKRVAVYPAVILCALCISKNTFAFPFVPTEMYYYVFLSIVFVLLALKNTQKPSINPLFVVIIAYLSINDMALKGSFSYITTMLFFMLLLSLCSSADINTTTRYLPFAFIFLSIAISYWALFCPEASVNEYNSANDMDQMSWRDPNYISCALCIGLIVSVRELLRGCKNMLIFVLLLLTVISATIALLSFASRGVILAVVISIGVMMLFSKVGRRTKVLTILGLSAFVVFLYTNQYFDFVISRFSLDDGTGSGRTTIWREKLNAFFYEGSLLNYLFGFGQEGGFKLGYAGGISTHNDYVSVIVYYGLLGVFLFISAIAYPLTICAKEDRPQIVALLIYLLVCSMTIEPLSVGNIAYISFFFYITLLARQSGKRPLIEYEE